MTMLTLAGTLLCCSRNFRRANAFGFLLCTVFCITAWSQAVNTAQIIGTVRDSTGLAVPGAEVKLTQTETGITRTLTSAEDGSYTAPSLPVGPYQMEVSKDGFTKYVQTGIVLQVASNPTIDVALRVGSVNEQINVEASGQQIETQSTGIGQVIDSKQVTELPLVGRQVTDLVVLSGAAVQTGVSDTNNRGLFPGVANFSIAGGLNQGNTFSLDGAMHNDVYANSAMPLPFPDALQEFKVETSALPAQYGFHSGGAVNAVTKSGTNQMHGTLFEFVRNSAFNARGFFDERKDGLKRNQFGGTIGGAIKKNKLFFFAGYQGTITRQSPLATPAFVPTQAMLNGDMRGLAQCQGRNLGGPFVNNQVNPNLISPVAKAIAARLPAPTDSCGRTFFGNPVASDQYFGTAKVDWQISDTHSLFVRYLGTEFDQATPYDLSSNVLTTALAGAADLLQSIALGDTYLFGSKVVNSFRATYNRTANQKTAPVFFGPQDVGIKMFTYVPNFTVLSVGTTTSGFTIGSVSANPNRYATVIAQISDDVIYTRGSHQMSFGGILMGFQSNTNSKTWGQGQIQVTGSADTSPMADFLLGRVQSFTQGGPSWLYIQQYYLGLYAQDAWRIKSNFTLNYGLRWEPYFPQQFGQNTMNHFVQEEFVRGTKSTVYRNAPPGMFYPGDPLFGPNGSSGMNKRWGQIAPRIGFVWDPTGKGKTVIRSGYGIFYDQTTVELNIAAVQAPPWGGRVQLQNPVGGIGDPWQGQIGGNPFPFVLSPNAPFPANGVFNTYNANTKLPYAQQWNFNIQHQLGRDWLISANYIGNAIVHLQGGRETNPAIFRAGATTGNTAARRRLTLINPAEGAKIQSLAIWDDGGTRSYQGLLLSAQKRFSQGFNVTANYTWSHCLSTFSNTFLNNQTGANMLIYPTRVGDRGNCVNSGSDVRHIANFSSVATMPKLANVWANRILGNWRGSATVSLQSGPAMIGVYTGADTALNGINPTTQRANQVLPNVYGNQCTSDLRSAVPTCNWLNRSAFGIPTAGTLGNMNPGTVNAPGLFNVNAGLSRLFPITERHTIELRAEAQNAFNHANFQAPNTALNNATFGQLRAVNVNSPSRIMQFAVKYTF